MPGKARRQRRRMAMAEPVQIQVHHRRGVQRQCLAHHQSTDDRNAQRPPDLAAVAEAERQRQGTKHGRAGRHHDRAEAQHAGLEDRVTRGQMARPFRIQREVDHHDGVLLDDADQQDHPDQRDDAEFGVEQHQRQHRADTRRGQRRQDGDRVDRAFIQNAQHDVDSNQCSRDQQDLVRQELLERAAPCPGRSHECSPACVSAPSPDRSPGMHRSATCRAPG